MVRVREVPGSTPGCPLLFATQSFPREEVIGHAVACRTEFHFDACPVTKWPILVGCQSFVFYEWESQSIFFEDRSDIFHSVSINFSGTDSIYD